MIFFLLLFWIFLNQSITDAVVFHCFRPVFSLTIEFIFAVICLLIFPNSGLLGLISLHLVFCWKFCGGLLLLWMVPFLWFQIPYHLVQVWKQFFGGFSLYSVLLLGLPFYIHYVWIFPTSHCIFGAPFCENSCIYHLQHVFFVHSLFLWHLNLNFSRPGMPSFWLLPLSQMKEHAAALRTPPAL